MSLYLFAKLQSFRLIEDAAALTTPALHYVQGGRVHHIPPSLPDSPCYNKERTIKYFYSASSGLTLHAMYRGRHYVVSNAVSAMSHAANIPAGTYAGEAAYLMFQQFISPNSYRVLSEFVTISHCGYTRHFSKGTAVWLTYAYGGACINLTFTQIKTRISQADIGYSHDKQDWYGDTAPTIQLHSFHQWKWSEHPFTVYGGIKFL